MLHTLLRGVNAYCSCSLSAVVLFSSCLGHQADAISSVVQAIGKCGT